MKTTQDISRFTTRLKFRGLKATRQRIAVHEAMMELGHASADMVSDWISTNADTKITVASVYNTLSQLAELGFYKRRMSHTNKMFFDVNPSKHLHLYDSSSSEYRDVFDDEFVEMVENYFRRRRFKGYKVDDIDVQLICHSTKRNKDQA